jgi:hypothetical protein
MGDVSYETLRGLIAKLNQHVADLEAENARLRSALRMAKGFIEALRVPQDIAQAGLQVWQGSSVMRVLDSALSQGQTGEGEKQ